MLIQLWFLEYGRCEYDTRRMWWSQICALESSDAEGLPNRAPQIEASFLRYCKLIWETDT